MSVHLLDAEAKASHLLENLVGGLDPFERDAALIVGVDVRQDGRPQLRDAGVRSALQRFSVSNPKNRSTRFSRTHSLGSVMWPCLSRPAGALTTP